MSANVLQSKWLRLLGLCGLALVVWIGWRSLPTEPPLEAASSMNSVPHTVPTAAAPEEPISEVTEDADSVLLDFEREMMALAKDESVSPSDRKSQGMAILNRMRQRMKSLPTEAATEALVKFLQTGRDTPTGLPFSLQPGGILDGAPTLRVAMLDLLGQFAPREAIVYGETIFANPRNADEWALGLRNLGWQNLDGEHTSAIRSRLEQMLDNKAWLAAPSEGFFHAFDLAVHLAGPTEFTGMASVMNLQDTSGAPVQNGTNHAAYLALDRITMRNSAQTLGMLAADPTLLAWSPLHRGSLLARGSVDSPEQCQALETCLATIAERPDELDTFTRLFPNRNGVVMNGLVTAAEDLQRYEEIVVKDQAALAQVNRWLQNDTFPALKANLETISARLQRLLTE